MRPDPRITADTGSTGRAAAPPLVLASASPRRHELLAALGVTFRVLTADIDESPAPGESPAALVARLAAAKAAAVDLGERAAVLAADTIVAVDERVLGKPTDRADAMSMLARLSGRTHQVFTGVCLRPAGAGQSAPARGRSDDGDRATDPCRHVLSVSDVTFREVSCAEAEAYWATGEPADKAGGYAIQGLAGMFVTRIEGSWSGIVGLPLAETWRLLRDAGIPCGMECVQSA